MIAPVAEIVDVDAIWKTVVGSILGTAGLTAAFSASLLGWLSAREAWDQGRTVTALAWGTIGTLGLAAVVAGVVVGLTIVAE